MSLICPASLIFMRHNVFRLTVPLGKCTSSSLRKLYLMLKLTEFIGKGAAPLAVFAENGKTGRKSLKLKKPSKEGFLSGARGRDRTADTRIFSPLLYQLSYPSIDC